VSGIETVVDSTYRWVETLLLAAAFTSCSLPRIFRNRVPTKALVKLFVGALLLIVGGLVLAPVFGESMLDALLLRARFGFMVPDEHPHSYGWAFIFGYSLLISSVALMLAQLLFRAHEKLSQAHRARMRDERGT
jgi:hypothetical protein